MSGGSCASVSGVPAVAACGGFAREVFYYRSIVPCESGIVSLQLVAATLADVGDGNPLDQEVSVDCAALILTGTGILGAVASNAIIALVLRLIGFAASGVLKGSFAAWWQSTMPLVSAGSVFAKLTRSR